MKERILVLNSGGFDSVILLHYLKSLGYTDMLTLFFDYGQRNMKQEKRKAKKVCNKLGIEYREIKIPKILGSKDNPIFKKNNDIMASQYVPMRNNLFLSYALSIAEKEGIKEIYVAFIKDPLGNDYIDTTPKFVEKFNEVSQLIGVEVKAPFSTFIKENLSPFMRLYNITEEDYFSCNRPKRGKPCNECGDCLVLNDMKKVLDNNLEQIYLIYGGDSKEFKESYLSQPIKKAYIDSCDFNPETTFNVINKLSRFGVKQLYFNTSYLGSKELELLNLVKRLPHLTTRLEVDSRTNIKTVMQEGLSINYKIKSLRDMRGLVPYMSNKDKVTVEIFSDYLSKKSELYKVINTVSSLGIKTIYVNINDTHRKDIVDFIEELSLKYFGEIDITLNIGNKIYKDLKDSKLEKEVKGSYIDLGVPIYNNISIRFEYFPKKYIEWIKINKEVCNSVLQNEFSRILTEKRESRLGI